MQLETYYFLNYVNSAEWGSARCRITSRFSSCKCGRRPMKELHVCAAVYYYGFDKFLKCLAIMTIFALKFKQW